MLSELHSLNLKLCKEYNKKFVLHLTAASQLSSGWRHNYSTETRPAGWANEQSIYSPMALPCLLTKIPFLLPWLFLFLVLVSNEKPVTSIQK